MELNNRRWYVTWFFLSLAILDKFWNRRRWGNKEDNYRGGTNLCHFMRVTMVWSPLIVVLHLAVYGAAFTVLTIRPISLFGWSGYFSALIALAIMVALVAIVIGIMAFASWLSDFIKIKIYEADMHRSAKEASTGEQSKTEPESEDRGPTFLEVWREHLKSVKQQICPIISFKN